MDHAIFLRHLVVEVDIKRCAFGLVSIICVIVGYCCLASILLYLFLPEAGQPEIVEESGLLASLYSHDGNELGFIETPFIYSFIT